MIKRVKLYINENKKSIEVAENLKQELKKYQIEIVEDHYDLAISIGGDGTFLKMVRKNHFNENISYIGINSGTLGFLQEIDINNCNDFVKRLSTGNYKEEQINIEETKIITEKETYTYESLNEVVMRDDELNTLGLSVYVDDEFLEDFSGDGILVSTSTGSTAYNMSFGGSIIYNTLDTLSITPIAPLNNKAYHSLTNSIIIPFDKKIVIIPKRKERTIFFQIDGENKHISDIKQIEIKTSSKKINCIRMNDFHFIKVVNHKILER